MTDYERGFRDGVERRRRRCVCSANRVGSWRIEKYDPADFYCVINIRTGIGTLAMKLTLPATEIGTSS